MDDTPLRSTILARCGFKNPAMLTACDAAHTSAQRQAALDCISIFAGLSAESGATPLAIEPTLDESNLGMDAWTLRYRHESELGFEVGYLNHIAAQHIPAASNIIASLVLSGYALAAGRVSVTRIHTVKHGQELIGYSIENHIELVKDDAALVISIDGHGNTLLRTLIDAQAGVTEIEYRGPAAPLGRGQAHACRQIAHDIANKHRSGWIGPNVHISVPFITRGRSGGQTKTAHRRFTQSEASFDPKFVVA